VKRRRLIPPLRHWCDRETLLSSIAKSFRSVRARTGISQETLAAYSEVDRTYVGQIERRIANPTIVTLDRLLTTLDASWAQFGAELDAAKAAEGRR
jgi:transcriptional regulator with XRE-family HTH domain